MSIIVFRRSGTRRTTICFRFRRTFNIHKRSLRKLGTSVVKPITLSFLRDDQTQLPKAAERVARIGRMELVAKTVNKGEKDQIQSGPDEGYRDALHRWSDGWVPTFLGTMVDTVVHATAIFIFSLTLAAGAIIYVVTELLLAARPRMSSPGGCYSAPCWVCD